MNFVTFRSNTLTAAEIMHKRNASV